MRLWCAKPGYAKILVVEKRGIKLKRLPVIHPFLFAIAPVVFLFAYNIYEVPATDLLLPIVVVIIGTLILFFSLRLVTRSYIKAGIITSYLLVLAFSYVPIRHLVLFNDLVLSLNLGGSINRPLYWGSLWVLLFITGTFLLIKCRSDFRILTKFLNVTAVTLIVISLINISVYEIKTINIGQDETNDERSLVNTENLPDIYYIILDMYARADTLKELYDYDNSEFIDYLTNKGFYMASRSRSNYSQSVLSLPSSVNMKYINYLSDTVDIDSRDQTMLWEMLKNNEVSRFLKSKGYRYIFITSGFFEKGMNKYAQVYRPQQYIFGMKLSNFAVCLIESTALSPFTPKFIGHYNRESILYCFDTLADMPDIKQPKFVFAHIICPHPPYVFDSDGNPVGQDNEGYSKIESYLEQLIFTNKKVITLVDEILSKSDVPPIIILQADHGTGFLGRDERMNIFNAYYLPEKDNSLLYKSITPVNSFRIVFNLYFDTDYDLLEDKSYYTPPQYQYHFIPVPPESNSD